MPERPVGKVEHYYPKAKAAAVRLSGKVKLGDQVHIVGHGDDFQEKVTSLQLDHKPIQEGRPGQSIGLAVKDRVHEGDDVLLVTPDGPSMPLEAKPKPTWSKPLRGGKAKPGKSAKSAPKRKPARKTGARASRKSAPRRKSAKSRARPARKPKPVRKAKRLAGRGKPSRKASRKR